MDTAGFLEIIDGFVWGPAMLVLLVGTGIFLTIRLKFLPWRNLGYAIKSIFDKGGGRSGSGDITPFQSLMTALAATIGTGNIAGVATALAAGGPGALVWMWLSALFGLSTKYAESVLAVKYREKNEVGEYVGGPMYALKNGLKNKKLGAALAFLFSVFAVLASFGIGNLTQANSIATAVSDCFNVAPWITGAVIVILCIVILIGGIKSIGRVCGVIVPVMAVFYIVSALAVIIINIENVPEGLHNIFSMAFGIRPLAGGGAGIAVQTIISKGVARGVFSNEAGLGSAPIAAAAAKTDSCSKQGYINMTGTFFDTLVVCTMTGLAVASSGALGNTTAGGEIVSGTTLTIQAFSTALGYAGSIIITIGISLFAFSTILGWEYYGEKSLEYLVSNRAVIIAYRLVFCLLTFVGATTSLEIAWSFADIMNALMAVPNLICLLLLSNVVAKECFSYQKEVIEPLRKGGRLRRVVLPVCILAAALAVLAIAALTAESTGLTENIYNILP
ncbi:MAG TPA: sodium:alanine symporter family protein [Candidatus Monoglobus merdigallinarum]|uniref:Sodium:alanine symporter family protein n=1 Tax=Candidatus Monoglobus merdigallinarum TaxID=2838698 RepID=A0A9D1TM66_9FIRM|nr:sodium:alanine symporter family protein [Candidatus Monoglobus merdigallinarum]